MSSASPPAVNTVVVPLKLAVRAPSNRASESHFNPVVVNDPARPCRSASAVSTEIGGDVSRPHMATDGRGRSSADAGPAPAIPATVNTDMKNDRRAELRMKVPP
ncbi:hypothetical protein [Asanoa ishikariensis]|uniref:hypothetical protein n=1 Tax=Asanoa ishikariensis TaxID=137265 RepID=UPI001EF1EE60|nr:hypothetical protein [Asanoa ishikariensis]